MHFSRKILHPMVSAAVALIAVTNFLVILKVGQHGGTAGDLVWQIVPIAVPTSVAVTLVMSLLYHTLQELFSEIERQQDDLILKASRDLLTGVANRDYFEKKLVEAIDRFKTTGEKFAVTMLDLDHFKKVNDLHGHQVGDALLIIVADRLKAQLRMGDAVARFGGDEFLILQNGLIDLASAETFCERICESLKRPYQINSLSLRHSASAGTVIADSQYDGATEYLRAADVALYDAKRSGRNCARFFSKELDDRLRRRNRLERDLHVTVSEERDVTVLYQPQISASGELSGVEAFFRWTHPEFGDVPPAEAVEIAEESDLILSLGEFVFKRAASLARNFPDLSVAINLSPGQFSRSTDFASRLMRLVKEHEVNPSQIELEITERIFTEIGPECDIQIQALRKEGFRVALDDFGTGYSSLSHLRRFEVDRLKLDKSIAGSSESVESIAVIRAAVGFAHLLGLEVIAEGIETQIQETIALESGCDILQGHLYGKPMTEHEFVSFVKERSRKVA